MDAMRQIKGAPGLELLPSEKDPRKLRWQRVEPRQKPKQKAPKEEVTLIEPDDEETRRFNELMEFLRSESKKGKRLERQLRKTGVPKKDAQRITIDYLLKRVVMFFENKNRGLKETPLPDYPIYPEEFERKPPNRKPINPVNPGYKIEVLGGTGDEAAAAEQFAEHLFGVLKEIHPLPKKFLKVIVAVPTRYKGIRELGRWMRRFYLRPSEAEGVYVFYNNLILLKGFRPIIHEFGHYLDDIFYRISWSEKYSGAVGTESLSDAYHNFRGELQKWFNEHRKEIIDLTFKRYGWTEETTQDPLVRRKIRQIRKFGEEWLSDLREIFAYTYEQYVIWKLMEAGRSDLAHFWLEASKKSFVPLLPAEMFKPVKDAFDRFFDAVRRLTDDEDVLKWLRWLLSAKVSKRW
jgi:hypothetical protein